MNKIGNKLGFPLKNTKGFTMIEVIIVLAIIGILIAIVVGPRDSYGMGSTPPMTADKVQAAQTASAMAEAQRQVGMPRITNFQQRKLMKLIYEITDQADLNTYAYVVASMTGKLVPIGKCIGYGVPFSAQFTNPEKITKQRYAGSAFFETMPQADPNGLFMPVSSSATWVLMVNPKTGEPGVVYVEPEIIISPFPLTSN